MAEKRTEGIGRVRWQTAFLGFYSVLSPQSSVLRDGPRRRVENVCGAHFVAQPGYDGSKKNSHDVSRMYPWQRKRLMMTHSYN